MNMAFYLSQNIRSAYDQLVKLVIGIPIQKRQLKTIEGTGGKVSVTDLIAYQIGWGKCLIRWYEAGIKGEQPEMPGEGFTKWNYNAIARYFYKKYSFDSGEHQIYEWQEVVIKILEIINVEEQTGNLDILAVWPWCTLSSGKKWPLSKWIQVNTVSPYKRAAKSIKQAFLKKSI